MAGEGEELHPEARDWHRKAAWILVIVTIVFWLWFGIGSALVEGGGWFNWLMHIFFPGGIFIFSALLALRWQRLGGVLLIGLGIFVLVLSMVAFFRNTNGASTTIMMLLTLALPPSTSGILFLVGARKPKES